MAYLLKKPWNMMRIMCATIPRKSSGLEKNWSILSSVLLESAQKKKEISILLGPQNCFILLQTFFRVLKHVAAAKTCEAMENWKRSCNVMDLAMKLGVFLFSYWTLLLFAERGVLHTTLGVLCNFTFFLSFFLLVQALGIKLLKSHLYTSLSWECKRCHKSNR